MIYIGHKYITPDKANGRARFGPRGGQGGGASPHPPPTHHPGSPQAQTKPAQPETRLKEITCLELRENNLEHLRENNRENLREKHGEKHREKTVKQR